LSSIHANTADKHYLDLERHHENVSLRFFTSVAEFFLMVDAEKSDFFHTFAGYLD